MRKIFMVLMMAVVVVTMASFTPVAPAVELMEPADIPVPVVEVVPLVSKEVVSTPPPGGRNIAAGGGFSFDSGRD